jgi:GntR family transcriptional regulator of arabinose operon
VDRTEASISGNNPQSISQQLRLELLRRIRSGSIKAGSRIPSERELAETYSISRTSVREAIAQLLIEGILTRGGGRGTYVSTRSRVQPERAELPLAHSATEARQIGFWISERIFNFVQVGYNRILSGASEECFAAGYGLNFLPLDDRRIRELLDAGPLTKKLKLRGSILAGGVSRDVLAALEHSGMPLILVDLLTEGIGAESVHIDYESGTNAAIQHLVSMGHKNIGFIGFAHSHKYEAYWRSLEAAGVQYQPRWVEFLEAS